MWLIEDDVKEIGQARSVGHHLPGVRSSYSHVTPPCSTEPWPASRPAGKPATPRYQRRHDAYAPPDGGTVGEQRFRDIHPSPGVGDQ